MPPTPHKNYRLPDKGARNWHVDLNANFADLDGDVHALDAELEAARPSAVYADLSPFPDLKARLDAIENELKQARFGFNLAAHRLQDFLAVGHNGDGTNKTGTFTFDPWETAGLSNPTRASARTITVDGDATAILQPGTSLRADMAVAGFVYPHVRSRAYDAGPDRTTIALWDDESLPEEAIDGLAYGVYRPNTPGAAGTPGAALRPEDRASLAAYYYDAAAFDDPFDAAGGRVAAANAGRVARVEWASGWALGVAYASAAPGAAVASIVRRLNGLPVETWTPSFDPDTGLLTALARS